MNKPPSREGDHMASKRTGSQNQSTSEALAEYTLVVHTPNGTADLKVVPSQGGDYFVVDAASRVVAALVLLGGGLNALGAVA
jgi:hypothetical protein